MNILYLTPVALALLLSGCAGMKSEFDCSATASNSCMTMDEANNKARSATERSEATKQPSLPRLAASGSQPLSGHDHASGGSYSGWCLSGMLMWLSLSGVRSVLLQQ